MTKFIWMSDLHFTHDSTPSGHDPRARLEAAITHVNTHHSDAEFCMITGDMVDRGAEADYAAVAAHLDRLSMPVYPIPGNHDKRVLFRAHLPLPDTAMADFLQYEVTTENGTFLCLDTLNPGSDGGIFCAARRDWLTARLARAKGPVFAFMHHPPRALGLPVLDPDNLDDGESVLDILSASGKVRYLFLGHVHRPISGTMQGIGFSTMRAVLYQAPPPRPAWDWDTFAPAKESPQLGVVTIKGGDVVIQYEEFAPYSLGT